MESEKKKNLKNGENGQMKTEPGFITLTEAAKTTPYSQEYLSLLARQGKLQAKKFGRNWYTTQEAIDDYLSNQGIKFVLPKQFFNTSYKGKITRTFNFYPFGGTDYQNIPKAALAQFQPPGEPIDLSRALSEKPESKKREAEPPVQLPEEFPKIAVPEERESRLEKTEEEKMVRPELIRTMQKDMEKLEGKVEVKKAPPEKIPEEAVSPSEEIPAQGWSASGGKILEKLPEKKIEEKPLPTGRQVKTEAVITEKETPEKKEVPMLAAPIAAPREIPVEEKVLERLLQAIEARMSSAGGITGKITKLNGMANQYFRSTPKAIVVSVIAIIIVLLLVGGVSFGNLDKTAIAIHDFFKDAVTLQGSQPGTHANEVLLLDKNGNISIYGHIETQGQLRSWVEQGVAPIVVDSTTTVENLSADYLDNLSSEQFTLAFVTKNGNVTYENVYLEGDVEVGKTLTVKGATRLLDSLFVYGTLGAFGGIETRGANLDLDSGTIFTTNRNLVPNFNADMVDSKNASDFDLHFITSNGSNTYNDISVGGLSVSGFFGQYGSFRIGGGERDVGLIDTKNWSISTAGHFYTKGSIKTDYNFLVGGQAKFTGKPGSGVSGGTVYINPSSGSSDTVLLGIAINGSEKFKVDAEGDLTVAGTVLISGASTFQGNVVLASPANLTLNAGDLIVNKLATTSDVLAQATSSSSGLMIAGTYYYVVTALNANGETSSSTEVSADVDGVATNAVSISWSAVSGAASYRVYGRAQGAQDQYWATANTSLIDTGVAGTAGTIPTDNTTGGNGTFYSGLNVLGTTISRSILPESPNTYSLGSPNYPWSTIYVDTTYTTTTYQYGNIIISDDKWIGFSSSAGRLVFDDQNPDYLTFQDASVGVATSTPSEAFSIAGNIMGSGNIVFYGTATSTLAGPLAITTSTPQLKLAYDSANYTYFGTDASGDLMITPSGQDTTINSNLLVTGSQTLTRGASFLGPVIITTTTQPQFLVRYDADNELNLSVDSNGTLEFLATGTDADIEFRTENFDNAIFIDDSTGRLGFGTTTPSAYFTIGTTTEFFVVDPNGAKVGIGTTTPSETFSIAGNIMGSGNMVIYGNTTSTIASSLIIDNDVLFVDSYGNQVGIGTTTLAGLLTVGTTTPALVVAPNSYVGIASSTPSGTLGVQGTISGSGNVNFFGTSATTTIGGGLVVGTNTLWVPAGGNVGIGTTIPTSKLTVNGGDMVVSLVGSATTTISSATSTFAGAISGGGSQFIIATSTSNILLQPYGGNVGIGTTTPEARLAIVETGSQNPLNLWANATSVMSVDVSGNVNITGAMYQDIYGSDDGLVLYLPFSEGMTSSSANMAYDRSPFGNDGTATNMPMPGRNATSGESGWATTTCKVGSCMTFDGVNDYVDAGTDASLTTQGARTIEFWMKSTQTAGNKGIIGFGGTGNSLGFSFVGTSPLLLLRSNDYRYWADAVSYFDGNWHHFAITMVGVAPTDILNATLRVDGILLSSGSTLSSGVPDPWTTHLIARNSYGYFNGLIDEVRVYNRALTADEIRAHYLRGTNANGAILADKFRVIGTDNNIDFIVNAGDVGIGTTTPSTKLAVAGNIMGSGNMVLYGTASSTIAGPIIQPSGNLTIGSAAGNLLLNPYGGNVGIATTSPSAKLAVTGNVMIDGDLHFIGDQTISGSGTLTINPTGNLNLQVTTTYLDDSGNLVILGGYASSTQLISPELTFTGDITIDANSSGGTTVYVQNDGGGVADLQIEGDVTITGGKLTLATGETIDAETPDHLIITSGGAGVLDIVSGGVNITGNATTSQRFYVTSGGARIIGTVDITGDTTITGTLHTTATTTLDSYLVVDTDTLFVHAPLHRVGISTTTPSADLAVKGDIMGSGNMVLYGTTASTIAGPVVFNGLPLGTGIEQGTIYIHPATVNANTDVLLGLAVGVDEKIRMDAEGDVQIVGLFYSTKTDGASQLSGGLSVLGNLDLGDDTSDTITFNGRADSSFLPASDLMYDLGSASNRWANFYAGTTTISNLVAGGTASSTFIINTDNVTDDTENANLEFERGTVTPNAILGWDASADKFYFNDFPVNMQNILTVSGTASSTISGPLWLTGVPLGTGLSKGSLYINPASGNTDYTLFSAAVAGSERFRIDAEGDVTILASLGVGSGTITGANSEQLLLGVTDNLAQLVRDGVTYVICDSSSNCQSATGGYIGGSGGQNYIPKFTNTYLIGNSIIYDSGTNVGIGNAGPTSKLTVNGGDFAISSAGSATTTISSATSTFAGGLIVDTSTLYLMSDLNRIGVATTTPRYALDVWGSLAIGTSTSPIFLADTGATGNTPGITVGADMSVGSIQVASSSGAITFVDTVVEASASAGIEESYSFQIDSNELLRIYAESDGLGGIQNKRVLIPSSVNFGIGTTTPRYALDVWGDIGFGTSTAAGTGQVPALYIDSGDGGRIGIGTTTLAGLLTVGTTTPAFVVAPNSYVGIGTTNPQYKLSLGVSNDKIGFYSDASHNASIELYNSTNANMNFQTTNLSDGAFTFTGGNVGIGTTGPSELLTVFSATDPTFQIGTGSATTTISGLTTATSTIISGFSAGNNAAFVVNQAASANSLYVAANGNVGIGTASPGYVLDVQGITGSQQVKSTTGVNVAYTVYNNTGGNFYIGREQSGGGGLVGTGGLDYAGMLNVQTAHALQLATNNIVRTTIDSGGNVGIGTAGPSELLTVFSATDPTFQIGSGSATTTIIGNATTTIADGLVVGGSDLYVSSNGNVGIGTAGPSNKLNVYVNDNSVDVGATSQILAEQAGTGDAAIDLLLTGVQRWRLAIDNSDSDKFKIASAYDLETYTKFTIDTSGNVGIATTSPRYKLDVWGDMAVGTSTGVTAPMNYPLLYVQSGDGGTSNGVGIGTTTVSGTMLTVGTTTPAFVVTSAGNIGIGTASPTKLFTIKSVADYEIYGTSDANFDILAGGMLTLGAGNNWRMAIDTSGNVGIGNAGPTSKLTVSSGNIAVSSAGSATTTISSGVSTFAGGIISQASSTISHNLSVGTSTTLFVDSGNGKVGIGTANPEEELSIRGSTVASAVFSSIGNSDASTFLSLFGGTNTSEASLIWSNTAGKALRFGVGNDPRATATYSELMRITSAGNVGIGTTIPTSKLTVNGGDLVVSSAGSATTTISSATSTFAAAISGGGSQFIIATSTSNVLLQPYGGNVGIATTTPAARLTIVETGSQNPLNLWANATSVMSVDVSGNVNITGAMYQDIYGSDDGLVLYFPFSEGLTSSTATTAYDRSPYGNDGILTWMATTTPSPWVTSTDSTSTPKTGTALYFSGSDDYINAGDSSGLRPGSQSMTFELWIKPTGVSGSQGLISKGDLNASGSGSYIIYLSGTNVIAYYQSGDDNSFAASIRAGVWTHLIIIANHNDDTVTLYKNGALVGIDSSNNFITTNTRTDPFYLGAYNFSGLVNYYTGAMDEVRVYNRALSADEVRVHYLRGEDAHGALLANKFRIINTTNNITFQIDSSGNTTFSQANATATFAGNIKVSDDKWIGLGENKGRLIFDDQATDYLAILDANVGIGTTTPRYKLDVWGDIGFGTSTGTNVPALYVDSGEGGRVGIGTTTLSTNLLTVGTTTPNLVVANNGYVGIGTADPGIFNLSIQEEGIPLMAQTGWISGDSDGPYWYTQRSRGGTAGDYTVVQNGDTLGQFYFLGSDGDQFRTGAVMRASADGTPGDDDMPGRLTFWTTPDNTASAVERMRIDNAGNVAIGEGISPTSPGNANRFLHISGANHAALVLEDVGASSEWEIQADSDLYFLEGQGSLTFPMIIKRTTGNVGIGNAGPTSKLTVNGGDFAISSAGAATTTISSATSTFAGPIVGGGSQFIIATTTSNILLQPYGGRVGIGTTTVDGLLTVGTTTPSLVVAPNGNVGIGTASPAGINIPIGASPDLVLDIYNPSWGAGDDTQLAVADIVLNSRKGGSNSLWSVNDRGSNANLQIGSEGLIWFSTGGTTERMRINSTGEVGIGNAGPTSKLTVNGGDFAISSAGAATTTISSATSTFAAAISGGGSQFIIATSTSNILMQPYGGSVGIGTTTVDGLLTVGTTTPSLVVASNGRVGIGTATPLAKVQIVHSDTGAFDQGGGTFTSAMRLTNSVGGGAAGRGTGIYFANTGVDSVGVLGLVTDAAGVYGDFRFKTYSGGASYVEALTIKSSGNVGIATTSPRYKLDVWGDMAIGTSTGVTAPMNYPLLFVSSGDGGTNNGVGIGTTTVSGTMLTIGTTTPSLVVSQNGYVGIGTASPNEKLHVALGATNGTMKLTGKSDNSVEGMIGYANGSGTYLELHNEADITNVLLRSYGVSYLNGGNVGIGNAVPTSKLTVNGGDMVVSSAGSATTTISSSVSKFAGGIISQASSTISHNLSVGTSTTLFVDSGNGYVGIGTASPGSKLDVRGGTDYKFVSDGEDTHLKQVSTEYSLIHMFRDGSSEGRLDILNSNSVKISLRGNANSYFTGGNVGVATTSPRYLLDVWGDLAVGTSTSAGTGQVPALYVDSGNGGRVGIGTTTPEKLLHLNQGTGGIGIRLSAGNYGSYGMADIELDSSGLNFYTGTTPSNRMIIKHSGNVGIGNAGPTSKLTVNGGDLAISSTGSATTTISSATSTFAAAISGGGSQFIIATSTSAVLLQPYSGYVAIGTTTASSTENFYVAGDHLLGSDNTARTGSDTSYVKAAELGILEKGGNLRIKFGLQCYAASGVAETAYGKIYRNGVAVGTEQTVAHTGAPGGSWSGYTTKSQDIGGWTAGDLIQLYTYVTTGGQWGENNFQTYVKIRTLLNIEGTIEGDWPAATTGYVLCATTRDEEDEVIYHCDAAGDIAEHYQGDDYLTSGDIVVNSPTRPEYLVSSQTAYSENILGVISTMPVIKFGTKSGGEELLALIGRVPVKVMIKDSNQPILINDKITSSDLPGIGMKAVLPGDVVGTALAGFDPNNLTCQDVNSLEEINWPEDDGTNPEKPCFKLPDGSYLGKAMVFVNPHWRAGSLDLLGNLVGAASTTSSTSDGFVEKLKSIVNIVADTITGIPKMIVNGILEVGNDVVTHSAFKNIVKVAKTVVEGRTIVIDNAASLAENSQLEVESEDKETLSFVTYSIVSPRKEIMVSGSGKLIAGADGQVEAKIAFHPYFSAIISTSTPVRVVVTPTSYINGNLYVAEKSIYGFIVKEINSQDPDAGFDWIVTARLTNPDLAQEVLDTTEIIATQEVAPSAENNPPPVCQNGENRACNSEVGACAIGVQICEQGVWGECMGAVMPTEELCDGVDNDCDGEIDEEVCGATLEPGPEPEPEVIATTTEPIVEEPIIEPETSTSTDQTVTTTEPIIEPDISTSTDEAATSTEQ